MQPFSCARESPRGQARILALLAIAMFASGGSRGRRCPFALLLAAREAHGPVVATQTMLS